MSKKFLLIIFTLPFFTSGCFTVKNTDHFTYCKLNPADYARMLKDSADHYLIDVRTPGEYRTAHINNAVNYDFLAFHFGRDVDSLSRNKTAFIYCQTCHRSPFAAKIMKHKGFVRVYDLKRGFSNWTKAGLPASK